MHTSLSALGWDDDLAEAFRSYADTHLAGRVARVDRGAVDVLVSLHHDVRARFRPEALPAVGDWVALLGGDDDRWVDAVLPRRTAIRRAAATGESVAQAVAANVDVVLVTVPVTPAPKPAFVERLVALAWDSGAVPILVHTKPDLTNEAAAIAADLAEIAPGVEALTVSVATGKGLTDLHARLEPGQTCCLLGRSGAGKSSLVNALLETSAAATAEVRRDGKGRHMTTHRQLFALPTGALVVDTPGLRGAGLWVSDEGIDRTFDDVEPLVDRCRFTDCSHRTEPGCAVLLAVQDGRISPRRLDSWRKLQREAAWMAARHDARLRAEQRRAWVIANKELRRAGRIRP